MSQQKQRKGSGFVFQLGVEQAIRSSAHSHGWEVLAREYPWRSDEGEGYLDLILRHREQDMLRMTIECKLRNGSEWIFLIPQLQPAEATRFRSRWVYRGKGEGRTLEGWEDFSVSPKSLEAEFCDVLGPDKPPMLEPVARELVVATEALASEELSVTEAGVFGDRALVYLPVIVIAARLSVFELDPSKIDLASALLPEQAREIPFVRFRKSLSTRLTKGRAFSTLPDLAIDRQRTIMVVSSAHIAGFLSAWEVKPLTDRGLPWADHEKELRRREYERQLRS